MPMAMGIGAGSEMLKPLAIAIVSGPCCPNTPCTHCIAGAFTTLYCRSFYYFLTEKLDPELFQKSSMKPIFNFNL